MKNSLDQSRLKELLDYDAESGLFHWRVRSPKSKNRVGDQAGCKATDGYIVVGIDGRYHKGHRLAWLHTFGEWPECTLDHINGVRDDNRIANLRLATKSENCRNAQISIKNKSGFKGVHWNKASKKWRATCKAGARPTYLGSFDTAEAAAIAYQEFASKHHGEFFKA